jgi:transcriptional regulator
MTHQLRPIETRVLAMRQAGLSDAEIGAKVRKSPSRVGMIAEWAQHPARGSGVERENEVLSPLARRVLAMRAEGQSHAEIGERFRRSPRFVRQVEGLAHFRRYRELLG